MGMEHLARNGRCVGGERAGAAIGGIADYGMAQMGKMHADLMGTTGFDFQPQQRGAWAGAHDFVTREGGTTFGGHRHFFAVDGMAADGLVDFAARLGRDAPHQCEIFLAGGAAGELRDERGVGGFVLGHDQNAGGVFVEAVDDSGAQLAADALQVGAVVQEGVDQGVAGVAGGWVDDEPGGFVDDEEVVVFVKDSQRDIGGGKGGGGGGGGGEEECVAGGERGVGFAQRRAVERDVTVFD